MKIKVCGMRNPSNIKELVRLKPDYIGFIFYPPSKRYIGAQIPAEIQAMITDGIRKVGVFVNEPLDNLINTIKCNQLDMVQLHGRELPDYCETLKKMNISVIKVFSISPDFDFGTVNQFDPYCDYYLFDTAGILAGGSGIKFDWRILGKYVADKPFFLSGGIQPTDIGDLKRVLNDKLYAIDVNSGFEIEPGLKDISKLRTFIDGVRSF
jgi:phosphoribosylanthranilate isomerase